MKRISVMKKGLGLLAAVLFTAVSAFAEGMPEVEDRGLDLTEKVSVRYPYVTGMEDGELQDAVNVKIQAECGIEDYLARAALLISEGSLRTEWSGGILGQDVFSCAVSAQGSLKTPRETHVWTACSLDLRDGHEIGWDELVTDEAVARDVVELWLERPSAEQRPDPPSGNFLPGSGGAAAAVSRRTAEYAERQGRRHPGGMERAAERAGSRGGRYSGAHRGSGDDYPDRGGLGETLCCGGGGQPARDSRAARGSAQGTDGPVSPADGSGRI